MNISRIYVTNNTLKQQIMQKIRKIIEFVLALFNFLFHFKPVPDEESPVSFETYPRPAPPDTEEGDEPLFETVR